MKRSPTLAALSREHHTALVLAKRARLAAESDAEGAAALIAGLPEIFRKELEPHFRQEEEALLPLLETAGAIDLAARTRADHDNLRALAASLLTDGARHLAAFGNALAEHVRFEERELFAAAEALLPAHVLAEALLAPSQSKEA